jgi:hypothetical protein
MFLVPFETDVATVEKHERTCFGRQDARYHRICSEQSSCYRGHLFDVLVLYAENGEYRVTDPVEKNRVHHRPVSQYCQWDVFVCRPAPLVLPFSRRLPLA